VKTRSNRLIPLIYDFQYAEFLSYDIGSIDISLGPIPNFQLFVPANLKRKLIYAALYPKHGTASPNGSVIYCDIRLWKNGTVIGKIPISMSFNDTTTPFAPSSDGSALTSMLSSRQPEIIEHLLNQNDEPTVLTSVSFAQSNRILYCPVVYLKTLTNVSPVCDWCLPKVIHGEIDMLDVNVTQIYNMTGFRMVLACESFSLPNKSKQKIKIKL
jgi:hypothetical protein